MTRDTAHALIDSDKAARALFYVALTHGRLSNHAYVVQSDPHEVEAHLDQPEPLTRVEQLTRVLARRDADLSATETLKLEVDRHASLSVLLAEHDLLAHEAQTDRWAALLDVAPFPENIADDVFPSPHYEHLEGALARHEAAYHHATATTLAPTLTPGEDQAQIPGDMQTAPTDGQQLIEAAERRALHHALKTGGGWTKRIGRAPTAGRARAAWLAHATTIALYGHRYEIIGTAPLSKSKDITKAQQATEYRIASAALRRAQSVGEPFADNAPRRDAQRVDPAHRL